MLCEHLINKGFLLENRTRAWLLSWVKHDVILYGLHNNSVTYKTFAPQMEGNKKKTQLRLPFSVLTATAACWKKNHILDFL